MKLKGILALLFVALTVFGFSQAEDPALRKDLEAFFAKFDKLMATNPNATFDLLAADYTNVDLNGKHMDRGQFKEMVRSMAGSVKDMRSKTLVKNVRGSGNEAVAWCEEVYSWKQKKGNGWVEMKSTSRWAESLRKTGNGGWVFYYSQQLPTNEPWDFHAGG